MLIATMLGLILPCVKAMNEEGINKLWKLPKQRAPYLTAKQEKENIIKSLKKYKLVAQRKNTIGFKKSLNFKRSPRSQICYDNVIDALEKGNTEATVIKRSAENVLVIIDMFPEHFFEFDTDIINLVSLIKIKK